MELNDKLDKQEVTSGLTFGLKLLNKSLEDLHYRINEYLKRINDINNKYTKNKR